MYILREVVVLLHEVKKGSQKMVKVLKIGYTTIDVVHDWGKKYMNTPIMLVRKSRYDAEVDRENIIVFLHIYEDIHTSITNIITIYSCLYNGFGSLVRMHMIPYVGTVTDLRRKNPIK